MVGFFRCLGVLEEEKRRLVLDFVVMFFLVTNGEVWVVA
jgi:hypothetical protein